MFWTTTWGVQALLYCRRQGLTRPCSAFTSQELFLADSGKPYAMLRNLKIGHLQSKYCSHFTIALARRFTLDSVQASLLVEFREPYAVSSIELGLTVCESSA